MKLKPNKVFLMSFLIMFFASCSKDDNVNNPNDNNNNSNITDWDWVKVGHQWVYDECLYDEFDILEETCLDTVKITSITDNCCELYDENYGEGYCKDNNIWHNRGLVINGCWNIDTLTKLMHWIGGEFYYKHMPVGTKWQYNFGNPYATKATCAITSTNASITVPAGTFSCYKIETKYTFDNGFTETRTTYVNKKYGLIMTELKVFSNSDYWGREVYKLKSKNF